MAKGKCDTCKHYSRLVTVPRGFGECWYCQAGNCIFCTHDGKDYDDYELGENDGGRTEEPYEYEEDDEGE